MHILILYGGRGRAEAGRRGEDSVDIYILIYYLEEGAGRKPVGGRRRRISQVIYDLGMHLHNT